MSTPVESEWAWNTSCGRTLCSDHQRVAGGRAGARTGPRPRLGGRGGGPGHLPGFCPQLAYGNAHPATWGKSPDCTRFCSVDPHESTQNHHSSASPLGIDFFLRFNPFLSFLILEPEPFKSLIWVHAHEPEQSRRGLSGKMCWLGCYGLGFIEMWRCFES